MAMVMLQPLIYSCGAATYMQLNENKANSAQAEPELGKQINVSLKQAWPSTRKKIIHNLRPYS